MTDNEKENSSRHSNDEKEEKSSNRSNVEEKENENISEQNGQGKEEQENEKEENQQTEKDEKYVPFSYFEEINNTNDILDDTIFDHMVGMFKYSICILIKDDSIFSSQLLFNTLKGIELNLKELNEKVGIKSEQISIFIFVNRIFEEYFFKDDDKEKLENDIENKAFKFLMRERTFKEETELKNIKFYIIANHANYVLYDITALKCYYSILSKLKKKNKLMFSSVMTAGVFPLGNSLISLIQYSYHEGKKHGIAIAPIEYKPSNLFSKISLYEKIHFNIFNMNYYYESYAVPVSSLLCIMTLDDNLIKYLNNYYNEIWENASIDYHDYNLGLKLIRENKKKYFIKFNYDKALANIGFDDMTYLDYQKEFINRHSGYYGNFFEILRAFADCNSCNPIEKIFLFFQIIAIATEFFFPSLASMVIYTIFYQAFKTTDYRIALFLTSLYLCMMFASGVCSLIAKDTRRMVRTNYFLYIFMEVFYLLVIVCSVPAMHFSNKENYEEDYKFNKIAISLIIILTFIPYIIPFLINISTISNNIISLIFYLFLAASCSTSNFNMAKIWNAPDTSGGNKIDFRKSVFIIIYLCFNLFIGWLSFYNIGTKKKANCVMALGIMFLIYNFFRMLAIIIKSTCNKEESFKDNSLLEKIKKKLEQDENEDEEEDNINKNKKENNYNYNDSNNKNEQNDSNNKNDKNEQNDSNNKNAQNDSKNKNEQNDSKNKNEQNDSNNNNEYNDSQEKKDNENENND